MSARDKLWIDSRVLPSPRWLNQSHTSRLIKYVSSRLRRGRGRRHFPDLIARSKFLIAASRIPMPSLSSRLLQSCPLSLNSSKGLRVEGDNAGKFSL